MTTTLALRRLAAQPRRAFWGYLALLGLAELITAALSPAVGLTLHAALLVGLTLHGALAESAHQRRLALGLMIAPLIRLLSLTLPLTRLPQLAWYPTVALPLLVAIAVVVRQSGLGRRQLGLTWGRLPLELAMVGFGFGLGALEYLILRPQPLLTELSWLSFSIGALSLLIFTGFVEELLFRGLLQHAALRALGRGALLYGALLFAVLHIGYLSLADFGFVFVVGLIFGVVVMRTGSILGVTLAHGSTNITLFLLLPQAAAEPASALATLVWWLVGAGSLVGALALALAIRLGRPA